jgi:hypothetical protein
VGGEFVFQAGAYNGRSYKEAHKGIIGLYRNKIGPKERFTLYKLCD